jgi:hypothetical protein
VVRAPAHAALADHRPRDRPAEGERPAAAARVARGVRLASKGGAADTLDGLPELPAGTRSRAPTGTLRTSAIWFAAMIDCTDVP